eukprot:GFYU01066335.1.p1 GENE.GFYU01066335.1~~GFYU01066335.1.p1  ORF type:complete len:113 (-),score=36.10 GFYU01066335.1:196-507(-)
MREVVGVSSTALSEARDATRASRVSMSPRGSTTSGAQAGLDYSPGSRQAKEQAVATQKRHYEEELQILREKNNLLMQRLEATGNSGIPSPVASPRLPPGSPRQ